jgi:hypothetical protein
MCCFDLYRIKISFLLLFEFINISRYTFKIILLLQKMANKMHQLSREKAEKLIDDKNVVSTKIEQDKNELRVYLTLADGKSCLVTYDKIDQTKKYFLKNK